MGLGGQGPSPLVPDAWGRERFDYTHPHSPRNKKPRHNGRGLLRGAGCLGVVGFGNVTRSVVGIGGGDTCGVKGDTCGVIGDHIYHLRL